MYDRYFVPKDYCSVLSIRSFSIMSGTININLMVIRNRCIKEVMCGTHANLYAPQKSWQDRLCMKRREWNAYC